MFISDVVFFISFQVAMLMIFDSAPESIKKMSFKVWCLKLIGLWTLDFLTKVALSRFFFVTAFL